MDISEKTYFPCSYFFSGLRFNKQINVVSLFVFPVTEVQRPYTKG